MTFIRWLPGLVLGVALLLGATGVADAQGVSKNIRFPIRVAGFVPCAAGGAGEDVFVEGSAHMVVRPTSERQLVVVSTNYQGLSGAGETTGDRYRGVGAEHSYFMRLNGETLVTSTVETVQFIGQGPDNNFLLHF